MRFPLFALLASNVLLVLGTGLQSVLMPVRAHLSGFSDQSVGLVGAAYYLGFMCGCLAAPWLVRRAGHTRAFAVLAVVAAQTFPLHAVLPDLVSWLGLRIVAGFCFAGLSMVVESWINEACGNETRGSALSVYLVITSCASAGGQSMLRLTDPAGLTACLLVGLCISLSLVPLAVSVAPVPQPLSSVRLDIRRLYRTSPVALVGCLFVGLANGAFWSLAPLVLQLHGHNANDAVVFMGAAIIGGAGAQWPLGRLSDRIDRRLMMLAACLGALASALPLALMPGLPWPAELALAAAFGATAFPLYALAVAHANDHSAPGSFVETSGGLLLTFGIGAVAGPLMASVAMDSFGGGLFLFTAAVHGGLALFVAVRMLRRRAVPVAARRPFLGFISACPAVRLIDPLVPRGCPAPAPAAVRAAPGRSPAQWAAR